MSSIAVKATRREWIGLAVIALPCLLYSMDLTIMTLALPTISAALHATNAQMLWMVDIYGFMVAGFLITMGTIGDRIGRRRLLLIGAAAFGIISILAALVKSAGALILLRALLGVAGATLAPSTLSLIRNMFHNKNERTTAIGIWMASFSAGAVIGPLLGGILITHFHWSSIFLISVPAMLLLLALGPWLLPEYRDSTPGRVDLYSVLLSLGAVLAVVYGMKEGAGQGLSWSPVLSLLVGVALAGGFLHRQTRLTYPMVDLQLFSRPGFSAAMLSYAFGFFVLFGLSILLTQYLQLVLDLSPFKAACWLAPWGGAFMIGSATAPRIAHYWHPRRITTCGLLLSALGFALLTQVGGSSDKEVIITGTVMLALGLSPLFTFSVELIIAQAPSERAGAAAALSETGSELSGALGIALLGSLASLIYRMEFSPESLSGVPEDALAYANGSLSAAVVIADKLLEPARIELLTASRHAFTTSMQFISATSMLIVLAAALISCRTS